MKMNVKLELFQQLRGELRSLLPTDAENRISWVNILLVLCEAEGSPLPYFLIQGSLTFWSERISFIEPMDRTEIENVVGHLKRHGLVLDCGEDNERLAGFFTHSDEVKQLYQDVVFSRA